MIGLVANEDQAIQFKEDSIKIGDKGQFLLAKWESNVQLASIRDTDKSETKLLGINRNKNRDTWSRSVDLSSEVPDKVTKRTVLKNLASIYDPIGLLLPLFVDGKRLYRLPFGEKKGWYGEIS